MDILDFTITVGVILMILKFVGIYRHYQHNPRIWFYPVIFLSVYGMSFTIRAIQAFGGDVQNVDALEKINYFILLVDGWNTLQILRGKQKIEWSTNLNGKKVSQHSFDPLKKANDNWIDDESEKSTNQVSSLKGTFFDDMVKDYTGKSIEEINNMSQEERYNLLEKRQGIDIKTNSDYIKKDRDNEEWN